MCETSLAGPTSGKTRIVVDTGTGKVPPLVAAGAEHRSSGSTARTCWTMDMARKDLDLGERRRPEEGVSGGELPAGHLRRSKTRTRRRRSEAPRVGPRGVAVLY